MIGQYFQVNRQIYLKTEFEDSSIVDNSIESIDAISESEGFKNSSSIIRKNKIKKIWHGAKELGSEGIKFGKKAIGSAIKFTIEHPEVALAIGATLVGAISNNNSNRDESYESNSCENMFDSNLEQTFNDTESLFLIMLVSILETYLKDKMLLLKRLQLLKANGFKLEDGQTWVDEY